MKVLYYDCFSGISGDMNLGAMIDIGVEANYLIDELAKLKLDGYQIRVQREARKGITGTKVNVKIESRKHHYEEGKAEHRDLKTIEEIITCSELNDRVKAGGLDMFRRLAAAEAKVHGTSPDKVRYQEPFASKPRLLREPSYWRRTWMSSPTAWISRSRRSDMV
jgi:uncharacterized protein (DUF111 family)